MNHIGKARAAKRSLRSACEINRVLPVMQRQFANALK